MSSAPNSRLMKAAAVAERTLTSGLDDAAMLKLSRLMRADLSPTEMAEHLAKREELWGKRNTAQSLRDIKGPGQPKGSASETAEATGVSKRAVQLATSRAKEIPSDIRDQIKGTKLDTGVQLDASERPTDSHPRSGLPYATKTRGRVWKGYWQRAV